MKEIEQLLQNKGLLDENRLKNINKVKRFGSQLEDYLFEHLESDIIFNNRTAKELLEYPIEMHPSIQSGMKIDFLLPQEKCIKIIETDNNRADQVAKKFLSRLAFMQYWAERDQTKVFEYAAITYRSNEKNSNKELLEYFKMMEYLAEKTLPNRLKVFCYGFKNEEYLISEYGLIK